MKAFVAGFAAAILIAVVAGVVLNYVGVSTAQQYSTEDVRL